MHFYTKIIFMDWIYSFNEFRWNSIGIGFLKQDGIESSRVDLIPKFTFIHKVSELNVTNGEIIVYCNLTLFSLVNDWWIDGSNQCCWHTNESEKWKVKLWIRIHIIHIIFLWWTLINDESSLLDMRGNCDGNALDMGSTGSGLSSNKSPNS